MKQSYSTFSLVTVISLFLGVIWLSPARAAVAPVFEPLGQIRADGMLLVGAMDMDEAGTLYVADSRAGLVHTFDQYGDFLQSFDLQVTGRGLAVTPDGSKLYVARTQSVVIYNLIEGEIAGELEGAVVDAPEFASVGEIDLDAAGNIYVVDGMSIKVYSAYGQFQNSFGGIGTAAGQFMQVGGMTISPPREGFPLGQVVVADSSAMNSKVHVFTLNSDLSVANVVAYPNSNFGFPAMQAPRGITYDAQGRVYFLEFMKSQVRVANEAFGYLGVYSQAASGVGYFGNVNDAVFDNVNSRLFVGCSSGRIAVLGVDGGQSPENSNNPPTIPTPQSPVGNSEVRSASPVLTFVNAEDPDGDDLTYLVTITLNGEVVYQKESAEDVGETTSVVADGIELAENTAYSWTVQAFDAAVSSAPSVVANFVVNAVDESPGSPELLAPADNASIAGVDLLSWAESDDPDPNDYVSAYQVEIAADEAFVEVLMAQSVDATDLELSALQDYSLFEDGAVYFWRVTAQDSDQLSSPAGAARRFVYDTTSLSVTANMPDAVVSFSGNHAYAGAVAGVAPLELRDFTPGTLSVVVTRDGFEPFVANVTLTEDANVALYAKLVPSMEVKNLSTSRNGINGRSGLSVSGAAMPFLVDFDNDDDLDLLVGDGSGQVSLFSNMQIAGRNRLYFDQGVSLELPVMPGAVPFVADWDNDGKKDLIIGQADGSVKLFVNIGEEVAPAFGQGEDLSVGGEALSVGVHAAPVVVDYNSDGLKDLLVGNGAGEVVVFYNAPNNQNGPDAGSSPNLSAPELVYQASGAAVPFLVDWDADGQQELLVTAGGVMTVYAQVEDQYQLMAQFSEPKTTFVAAFPIDLDGSGKQLLAGLADGQVVYLSGFSEKPVASFIAALHDKIAELSALITALESPDLLLDLAPVSAMVSAGDYAAASLLISDLALRLPDGAAQVSAFELVDLLNSLNL
ncbi:FG-GAP-like repeat-containing protein [Deltaproteobacteria bacterium IMCC39524]|nr:FG-GAP-like repeat-containing protein [Deltaproteobacteria bacterium IMCC39524]